MLKDVHVTCPVKTVWLTFRFDLHGNQIKRCGEGKYGQCSHLANSLRRRIVCSLNVNVECNLFVITSKEGDKGKVALTKKLRDRKRFRQQRLTVRLRENAWLYCTAQNPCSFSVKVIVKRVIGFVFNGANRCEPVHFTR